MRELFANDNVKLIVGLCLGVVVIMVASPPHSICDSKEEAYHEVLKPLGKSFAKNLAQCRSHTELGGCVELFEVIRRLHNAMTEVGVQCRPQLAKDKLTQQWLGSSMEILTRAAWGSRAPANRNLRYGWLEVSQVNLFCKLKSSQVEIYGEEAWAGFVDKMLSDLPDATIVGRDEAWARSLLSDPCRF